MDACRRSFCPREDRTDRPSPGGEKGMPGTKSALAGSFPGSGADVPMTISDEYRRRAGECLLFCQYVRSEASKNLLLQMALSWHELAERAENHPPLDGDERGVAATRPGPDAGPRLDSSRS